MCIRDSYKSSNEFLSDSFLNIVNKNVEIYYKTQSCETIEDCLFLFKGLGLISIYYI